MGDRIRAFDWSKTPLGPADHWPQSLRSALSILLPSKAQIALFWGPQLITLYNDAYRPVLGSKHPRALGLPVQETWSELWESGLRDLFDPVLRTGEAFWDDDHPFYMERHGYVEETYFNISYDPVRDESGNVGGIFCIVSETTNRVLGDRRLRTLRDLGARASEARSGQEACQISATILEKNPADVPFALFYLLDGEGKNAHLAAVANLRESSAAAPLQIAVLDGAGYESWPLAAAAKSFAGRLVNGLSRRFGRLSGGPWPEACESALVLPLGVSSQKKLAGFLICGVSPRRALDEAYRDFFDLVAGHVTTALANARAYEEERKRAEELAELDRAKTAFFSNVSHEFRTPLTLILGPMEDALADPETPAALRQRLALSHRNSLRLQKLVNSLLDFSRIEAGRIQASYEPTDLGALTADLASAFRSAVERAGMRLDVRCDPLVEPVYVDREMWEKIVFNLLSNAFKYTFEGEITVTLARSDGAAQLSVRDTGIGIADSELPRIFERFHRIEGARGRTHEGTGIGLALVQELVKLHGGSISAASTVGKETVFTVRVPLGSAHLPPEKIRADRAPASSSVASMVYREEALRWLPDNSDSGALGWRAESAETIVPSELALAARGARVLVADDNADMRDYVRQLLQPYYRVTTVADGEAALAAAREEHHDLLLTDVMMPRMDGFQLLHAVRQDAVLRTLPVIMLSARAGEEARVEGLGAGADDYLIKPFGARELLARVGAQLALSRLRAEALQSERALRAEAEILNELARTVNAELHLEKLIQNVTDVATRVTGAKFGAFFYNCRGEQGEVYLLHALSGAPRTTPLFAPTFHGESVVRIADVLADPRYGRNPPHQMPAGDLPVRSYLAAPVISRTGEVLGGLFFGHPEVGIFNERAERLALGIAAQAAVAIDNARLYAAAQKEIEERRQAEAAMKKAQEEAEQLANVLEIRVAERTGDLVRAMAERERLQDQLLQAQKMESIGTLASGVAHDFNNLLNIISSYAAVMRLQKQNPQVIAEGAAIIEETVRRGATLVQQMMTLGRRNEANFQPMQLNSLAEKVVGLLRETFPKTIAVHVDLERELPPIEGDENQLHQVLLNVCVNARDSMPDGGRIFLRTGVLAGEELRSRLPDAIETSYVWISVTDTGTGMDETTRRRIFEPFFTTKPLGQGTGLGLAVVYGIVKNHGGLIEVESAPAKGSTFCVYFPPARSAAPLAMAAGHAAPALAQCGRGEMILFVDDEEQQLKIMRRFLESEGYRVVCARDGLEAVEVFKGHKDEIAVAVLDLGLPKVNGWQAFQQMRELRPTLKALIATGMVPQDIEAQLAQGAVGKLITKPYQLDDILENISTLLHDGPV
jgi:signal transduction histidine kinase/DNA-binding response OmpR family regulator